MPPVASAPALQCVSSVSPSAISAGAMLPIARHAAASSAATAAPRPAAARAAPRPRRRFWSVRLATPSSRSSAQARFTAVGRVARNCPPARHPRERRRAVHLAARTAARPAPARRPRRRRWPGRRAPATRGSLRRRSRRLAGQDNHLCGRRVWSIRRRAARGHPTRGCAAALPR